MSSQENSLQPCTVIANDLPFPDDDPFDTDGNIQSAQRDRRRKISSGDLIATKVDDTFMKSLDNKLHDKPKDLYIDCLLDLTSSTEDVVLHYRQHLFANISEHEEHPLGLLKDRRTFTNGPSAAHKYADDCFTLQEYINGNVCDIGKLLKRHTTSQSASQFHLTPARMPTKHVQKNSFDENLALKESIAQLHAEVSTLKATVSKSDENIQLLKQEFQYLRDELILCSETLSKALKTSTCNDSEPHSLSQGLSVLSSLIVKIENSRLKHSSEIEWLKVSARDAASNISQLKDTEAVIKNNLKDRLAEVTEKITEETFRAQTECVSTKHHNDTIKSLTSKVKQCENSNNQSLEGTRFITNAFEKLATTLTTQMSNLCENVSKSLHDFSSTRAVRVPQVQEQLVTVTPANIGVTLRANNMPQNAPSCVEQPKDRPRTASDVNRDPGSTEKARPQTQCETSDGFEQQHQHRGRFKAATRNRSKSFVLIGISLDSDQIGLEDFLVYDMNIKFKSARFLKTGRTNCKVALIVMAEDDTTHIEHAIWPYGITCRPWIQRAEYVQRYQRNDTAHAQSHPQHTPHYGT